MTSKSSFVKLLREDLKKRMWLTALSAVIFIIVIPLINLLQAQSLYNGAGGIGDAAQTNWEQLCEWFAAEAGFSGGALRMSALIFGAVACGISSFSYLHSKSQVDFYHSLPVRRETWFAVTCTGSIVQIVIPYLVSYALLLVTGCAKGLMQADILRRCPLVVGMNLLYFLMLYSITVFAMMVTGKILMALFVLLLLSFGGSYIVSMKDYIMVQCYETYLSDSLSYGLVGNVLFGDAGWYSPVMLGSGMKYLYGTGQLWKGAAVMAAVTILSIAAALLLYRRRASESAGNALAFPKLMPAVKILTAVMTAVMFGAIAGSQNRQNGMNAGWLFGVGILTAVLTCAVMEFIYHTDIRLVFQKKCSLAVSVSAVVLILAAAEYDWFGYDTYLPERDEIKAMAFVSNVEKYRWAGANDTYFWDKMLEGGMNNLKVEQFDTIYDAAANGVANVGTDEALDSAVVAYYLKNGRTVYRQYRIEDDMLSRCMEELLDREGYRRKVFKMDILDGEKSDFQFLNFRQESVYVEVSKEEERKLLDTYRRELEEKPVSSFCQEEMVGEFSIVIESGVEGRQFYYTGRIYRSFTETLALLEQYGYNAATKIEPEEVKSMTHYKENEETAAVTEQNGERSGADGRPVTDREEMQRILDRVMWNSYDWEKGYETVADYYYGPEWVEIEFEDGHIAQYPLREEV